MMRNKLWMLAAILICGAMTVLTSCTVNDNPVDNQTLASQLTGEWIMEHNMDGAEVFVQDNDIQIPADADMFTSIYHFDANGTGWYELVFMKDGKCIVSAVSRYGEGEFTYTIDKNGKVLVNYADEEIGDELAFDGNSLTTLISGQLFSFARATNEQMEKYKEEADDFHGGADGSAFKGYPYTVTVKVTRKAGASNNFDGTLKSSFSKGDKLFVKGYVGGGAFHFAGTLEWQSGETFSGTILTQKAYSGTGDKLFKLVSTSGYNYIAATLLPAGYENYNCFQIKNADSFRASIDYDSSKAFAATKAAAVEQFAYEFTNEYRYGFALIPRNAIVNFTVTGLTPSADVTATVSYSMGRVEIGGKVTTDASGKATFAIGLISDIDPKNLQLLSLKVGGRPVAITSDYEPLREGTITDIIRNGAPELSAVIKDDIGKIVGQDGKIYSTQAVATAVGTTPVAMIAYVGNASDCTHGLAIALSEVGGRYDFGRAQVACSNRNEYDFIRVTNGTWRLPTIKDWQNMLIGCGASGTVIDSPSGSFGLTYNELNAKLRNVGGDLLPKDFADPYYWSSTDGVDGNAWVLSLGGGWVYFVPWLKSHDEYARCCLVF